MKRTILVSLLCVMPGMNLFAQGTSYDVQLDSIIQTFYNLIPNNDTFVSRNLFAYQGNYGPDTLSIYQNPNKNKWVRVSQYAEVYDPAEQKATSSYTQSGLPEENYNVYNYDQGCMVSTRWYSTDWGDSAQNYLLQSYDLSPKNLTPCDYDTVTSWTYSKVDTNNNMIIKIVSFYSGGQLQRDSQISITVKGDTSFAHSQYNYPGPGIIEKLMLNGKNADDTASKMVVYLSGHIAAEKIKMTSRTRAGHHAIERIHSRIDSIKYYNYDGNGSLTLSQFHNFYYSPYTGTFARSNKNSGRAVVYPNPVQGQLFVSVETENDLHYKIMNSNGSVVSHGSINPNHAIEVGSLPSGLYQISLTHKTTSWNGSFIVSP